MVIKEHYKLESCAAAKTAANDDNEDKMREESFGDLDSCIAATVCHSLVLGQ